MTESQLERRSSILNDLIADKRNDYEIRLDNSFISIRNIQTDKGIYTDSLQAAKGWLKKDLYK